MMRRSKQLTTRRFGTARRRLFALRGSQNVEIAAWRLWISQSQGSPGVTADERGEPAACLASDRLTTFASRARERGSLGTERAHFLANPFCAEGQDRTGDTWFFRPSVFEIPSR